MVVIGCDAGIDGGDDGGGSGVWVCVYAGKKLYSFVLGWNGL